MIYYRIFDGQGRTQLADDLDAEDPFGLDPRAMVERVSALGYVPAVDRPSAEPWPTLGSVHEVVAVGRTLLVAVGRDAERISVQEMREDAYEGE